MKIHFDSKEFLKVFRLVKTAAPKASITPTLRYIKVQTDKKGVILQATDTKHGIQIHVDADVSEPGDALLPIKKVIEALGTAKGFRATIESTKEGIKVINAESLMTWHFACEESKFPQIPRFTAKSYHEIDAEDMLAMIRRTTFAVEKIKKDDNYRLNGVCFENEGDILHAVATDGKRLAIQKVTGKSKKNHTFEERETIIPVNALQLLEKCLKELPKSSVIKIALVKGNAHKIIFQYGAATIFAELIKGLFPKWRSIIPSVSFMHKVTISNDALKLALKNLAPLFSKTDPHVDLVFAPNRLTLNAMVAKTPYKGSKKEKRGTIEIACDCDITGTLQTHLGLL